MTIGTRRRFGAADAMNVVVVGGGPAGIACTLRLRQYGHRVALIERGRFERTRIGEVVPPEIRKPLSDLAVWPGFRALRLRPVLGVNVRWGSEKWRRHDHFLSPYRQAWVLPKSRFDRLLADTAAARGVAIRTGSVVRTVERVASGWRVQLNAPGGNDSIYCRYLVDATGRQSAFSRMIGRHAVRYDTLVGVAGVQRLRVGTDGDSLRVESDVDGWRYGVALGHGRLACVYMADADSIPRGGRTRLRWWQERIGDSLLEPNVRLLEADCLLHVMPAQTVLSLPIANGDFLSVGDSANALDPLSGMGVLRALRGGILGADTLHATFEGNKSALKKYAENVEQDFRRQLDQRIQHYSEERRWPKSIFWIRRIQKQLEDVSIELHPGKKLVRKPGSSPATIVQYTTSELASCIFEATWNISESPVVAFDLASQVRLQLGDRVSDRCIIAALQVMMSTGVLTESL